MREFAIAFPDERRFDDRALRSADDGADFEALVSEVISSLAGRSSMAPRLARGRDGAIDLIDDVQGERCAYLAETIERSRADGSHRVRLIVMCRASAMQAMRDVLADLEHGVVMLALRRDGGAPEEAFSRWAVQRILATGGVPNAAAIAAACDGLPVLAAFAVFLHRRAPRAFAAQFGDLLALRDFATWASHRVAAIVARHPGTDSQRILASIALRLPMPLSEADALDHADGAPAHLLETLRADRWTEMEGDLLVAAHDVFADSLTAYHVFGLPGHAAERLTGLLRAAFCRAHCRHTTRPPDAGKAPQHIIRAPRQHTAHRNRPYTHAPAATSPDARK